MTDTTFKTDLSNYGPEEVANAMRQLKSSLGWLLLKDICDKGEMAEIRKSLLSGMVGEEKIGSLVEVEKLQYKLSVFEELFKLPDTLISNFVDAEGSETEEAEEHDPYHTDVKEMVKQDNDDL